MTRVLILGGSGHLGTALRDAAPAGTSVWFTSRAGGDGALPFALDRPGPLPEADLVIGSFPLARQLQGGTDADVQDAVRRYLDRLGGARLVQLSTDAVYSGRAGGRGEQDPPDPTTPYGIAQARVDAALLALAPGCLIVRTSFIFGLAGGRLDKRLAPLLAGDKAIAAHRWPGNIFRSPTEVGFLAAAIWAAAARGVEGPLNLCGPRLSIHDFFGRALAAFGAVELPAPTVETGPAVARDTSLSTARMAATLDLHEGDVWTWYRRKVRDARAA